MIRLDRRDNSSGQSTLAQSTLPTNKALLSDSLIGLALMHKSAS